MKHMMIFELIDHVDGSFESELEGWEHAQAVANGRVVRLVQSRQIYAAPDDDEIGQKVKMVDLLGSKLKIEDDGFSVSEQMLANRSAHFVTLICLGLCFSLFFAAKSCHGATVVTEEFLDRLAWRESRNNPAAVGQVGELGAYQLRACAVEHVNNKKGWKSDHKKAALKEGRKYARAYCMSLESELGRWIGRPLVQSEVDHAYQLGPTGFLRKLNAGQFQSSSK